MKKDVFKDKNAIVTGGSSGIGLEFARQLAAAGSRLCLISIDAEGLEKAKNEIGESVVGTLCLDLGRDDATATMAEWCDSNDFQPDILINDAGIFDFKKVNDLSPQRIDLYINLHVRAVAQTCRYFGERMAKRGSGWILNMSSRSCWMPMPGIALYSSTKAFIRAFSRALNIELNDDGVAVMVACPGGISTSLFGLSPKLRRLGVRLGVLTTPQRFVKNALRRLRRRRQQYINGWFNRFSIFAVSSLPRCLRLYGKRKALDRPKPESSAETK